MLNYAFKLRNLVLATTLALSSMALAGPNDKVQGTATFTSGSATRTLDIKATEKNKHGATGTVFYTDTKTGSFVATVTTMNVDGDTAWLAARIDLASNSAWLGKWVFIKIVDGGKKNADTVWMGLVDQDSGELGVIDMLIPEEGAFKTKGGDFKIK